MKRLGKNKKRRWQYCYRDIDSKIQDAVIHKRIIDHDFAQVSTLSKINDIVKGDKNSAKPFNDIPSACDRRLHTSLPKLEKRKLAEIDIWKDVPASMSSGKGSTGKNAVDKDPGNHSLPCPGQSYNPTLHDHLSLISRLKTIESAKRKRELKTERFVSSLRGVKSPPNPLKDMEKFLHSLNTESNVTKNNEEVDEVLLPRKKPKKMDAQKKMKNDLENLPKLLKEIKREKKTRERRKLAAKAKNETRDKLKKVNLNIPFQLPNEISSSLRKLCPEGHLFHEVERRRNRCPRARKTLGSKRKSTPFERKR
uniref:Ribosome biogenesis protein NOP53 n=1 Tax=Schistosoma mansoni TaxID=6183 RepID=A0A3Q0KIK5_SCHMA